ncbi:helix-turn-helix transcriptional regulator, partial [Bacteroides xylanisolvens]
SGKSVLYKERFADNTWRKYRINEVCFIVGFNNPSYFARCFQKQFGILPKDYVKKGNIIREVHILKHSHCDEKKYSL